MNKFFRVLCSTAIVLACCGNVMAENTDKKSNSSSIVYDSEASAKIMQDVIGIMTIVGGKINQEISDIEKTKNQNDLIAEQINSQNNSKMKRTKSNKKLEKTLVKSQKELEEKLVKYRNASNFINDDIFPRLLGTLSDLVNGSRTTTRNFNNALNGVNKHWPRIIKLKPVEMLSKMHRLLKNEPDSEAATRISEILVKDLPKVINKDGEFAPLSIAGIIGDVVRLVNIVTKAKDQGENAEPEKQQMSQNLEHIGTGVTI